MTKLKKGVEIMELIATPYHLNSKPKHIKPVLNVEKVKILNIQLQPGETVPEHAVDADVTIIAKSGKVNFQVEGESVEVSPQQLLYMAPLEKHSLTALEASDLMVIQIRR
jgi:quercetin dioxygenase-like cupin family protein